MVISYFIVVIVIICYFIVVIIINLPQTLQLQPQTKNTSNKIILIIYKKSKNQFLLLIHSLQIQFN